MITNKQVKKVIESLERETDYYIDKSKKETSKRDYKSYEKTLYKRVKFAILNYSNYIDKAIEITSMVKLETRGRKSKLTLKEKVTLLLLKQLFGKSNREMELMCLVFSALTDINISYKTIERLYSDFEVYVILNNITILTNQKIDLNNLKLSGDGTGFSLTITKNYRIESQKYKDAMKDSKKVNKTYKNKIPKKKVFVYSFQLMDLKTRLFIAYGTSFKSEKNAYDQALDMLERMNISNIHSIRLDKYYSASKHITNLANKFPGIITYVIPKKNATINGTIHWKNLLRRFVDNIQEYLKEYFQRANSENGFSELKRRFGWKIAQRKLDRIDTAIFSLTIWHNFFQVGKE